VSKWTKFGAVAVGMAVAVGCGDDGTGPEDGDLTTAEKAALAEALTESGALAEVPFASFATVAVEFIGEIGTLDAGTAASAALTKAIENGLRLGVAHAAATSYEGAVGFIVNVEFTSGSVTDQGYFAGVVGWNGVNTATNTVDDLVVGAIYGEGVAPSTISGTVGGSTQTTFTIGSYWDGSVAYYGTSGAFTMNAGSFGGGTDCSGSGGGFSFECSYAVGSASGDLDFEGESTAQATYTQSPLAYSGLPILRMSIAASE
jgi:hypothetical protein